MHNTAPQGGGVYGTGRLRDSVIARNTGGGCSGAQLVGCTVADNSSVGAASSSATNCIFWGNQPSQVQGGTVVYSDVQGGYTGAGNINQDPLFVDPNGGDYRLQTGSPCIDKGDLLFQPLPGELDLDGHKRVWDGDGNGGAVVDMGAYEYGSSFYGDLNCDGVVNFGDINPFVLALSNPAGYAQVYPNCDRMLGDVNGDGATNFADINPFVALLTQ